MTAKAYRRVRAIVEGGAGTDHRNADPLMLSVMTLAHGQPACVRKAVSQALIHQCPLGQPW
jgi:hypothetical protein